MELVRCDPRCGTLGNNRNPLDEVDVGPYRNYPDLYLVAAHQGARLRTKEELVKAGETRTGSKLILLARGVTKTYRTGSVTVDALKDLSIAIERGEFLAVMGPSGSGKTTFLNCLSGLDEIDAGSVLVEDRDVHRMKDADRSKYRAEKMGFIFQSFNLIPVFTAAENVELPLLLAGTSPGDARRKAEETLERVGLGHRKSHRPNEMSGGEQQRVTIARALAGNPVIVWADEPTGNLDTETAWQVMDLLHQLNADGLTVVLVTHDPAIGAKAGRVIRMRDGAIETDPVV